MAEVETVEDALPEGYCTECRHPLDSELHRKGLGLHGHVHQLKSDADKQRRDVMKRAHEFADEQRQMAALTAYEAEFGAVPKAKGK